MSPIKGGAGPTANIQAFTYTKEGEPIPVRGVIDLTMEKEDIAEFLLKDKKIDSETSSE